jgi:hypothetical protein
VILGNSWAERCVGKPKAMAANNDAERPRAFRIDLIFQLA